MLVLPDVLRAAKAIMDFPPSCKWILSGGIIIRA